MMSQREPGNDVFRTARRNDDTSTFTTTIENQLTKLSFRRIMSHNVIGDIHADHAVVATPREYEHASKVCGQAAGRKDSLVICSSMK
jgi:hypothetical protein